MSSKFNNKRSRVDILQEVSSVGISASVVMTPKLVIAPIIRPKVNIIAKGIVTLVVKAFTMVLILLKPLMALIFTLLLIGNKDIVNQDTNLSTDIDSKTIGILLCNIPQISEH